MPTTSEPFAANVVELPRGIKKAPVMREVPEDSVKTLVSNKECLAACDIAVFVHDRFLEKRKKHSLNCCPYS